jgi:hypothetical protein
MDKLRKHTALPARPEWIPEETWSSILTVPEKNKAAIKWVGFCESTLFFAAFWLGQYEIAAGWLVFKTASKWETWKSIGTMPSLKETEKSDERQLFLYGLAHQLASLNLQRWLLGTAANGIAALVGVALGRFVIELLKCGACGFCRF